MWRSLGNSQSSGRHTGDHQRTEARTRPHDTLTASGAAGVHRMAEFPKIREGNDLDIGEGQESLVQSDRVKYMQALLLQSRSRDRLHPTTSVQLQASGLL